MSAWRILLTTLFFLVVPTSYSVGEESPLAEDVKFDDVHANPSDYKKLDTNTEKDKPSEVVLTQCTTEICTQK